MLRIFITIFCLIVPIMTVPAFAQECTNNDKVENLFLNSENHYLEKTSGHHLEYGVLPNGVSVNYKVDKCQWNSIKIIFHDIPKEIAALPIKQRVSALINLLSLTEEIKLVKAMVDGSPENLPSEGFYSQRSPFHENLSYTVPCMGNGGCGYGQMHDTVNIYYTLP